MNHSITVIRNASISPSIRETTRYFINIGSKLAHDCLPELKIILIKKNFITEDSRLSYSVATGRYIRLKG